MTTDPVGVVHQLGAFRLTATGVEVDGTPSFEDWQGVFDWTRVVHAACQWWWGDLLAYGSTRPDYEERLSQALESSPYEVETLSKLKYVAESVAKPRRRGYLPFSVHVEVASLPAAQQEAVLAQADETWTVARTRQEVKCLKAAAINAPPPICWVVVSCTDPVDVEVFSARMVSEGRQVRGK